MSRRPTTPESPPSERVSRDTPRECKLSRIERSDCPGEPETGTTGVNYSYSRCRSRGIEDLSNVSGFVGRLWREYTGVRKGGSCGEPAPVSGDLSTHPRFGVSPTGVFYPFSLFGRGRHESVGTPFLPLRSDWVLPSCTTTP